ncbi:MAG: hypothetical protein QE265_12205 [Rhodoferax sp.]|nr:hypothetical protein [Rhodoferax sp.]
MFKKYSRSWERLSMALMLAGIVLLCQPWSLVLHQYSVAVILVGLIGFNIFSRFDHAKPEHTPNSMEH